jgi:cysteinyl-tRNA synthetase
VAEASGANGAASAPDRADSVVGKFRAHMDDDLSTPEAMAVAFDAVRAANSAFDAGDVPGGLWRGRAALACFAAVGIFPDIDESISPEALDLARRRDEARGAGDFAVADRLRESIVALGYRVEDTPAGTRVIR